MNLKKISVAALLGMAITGAAFAATQSGIVANIRFLTPLSFGAVTDVDMGDWQAGASGRVFQIDTTGAAGGADSADYISGATPGNVDILGSASATIDIVANNFVANGGVTITGVPCNYGGAGATTCDGAGISGAAAPGAGTNILLGATVQTSQIHADGATAAPTFDLVVTYP